MSIVYRGKTEIASGLELNYGSLHDVTEDVNMMREDQGEASVSVHTIWKTVYKIDHDEVYTEQE
eukprot:8377878-Ditylum_brightwellii.AAC.1